MNHNKPDSTEDQAGDTAYPVEASGWDASENFFVEKTALDWCHDGSKKVSLRSSLREGAVVFIRLNQARNANPVFPIAYQVKTVSPRDPRGFIHVSLVQLRPRSAQAHEPHALGYTDPGLAEANSLAPAESWEKT
jgi:hypothetical protein